MRKHLERTRQGSLVRPAVPSDPAALFSAYRERVRRALLRLVGEAKRTVSLTPAEPENAADSAGIPEPREDAEAPRRLVRAEMSTCVREYVARLAPEHRTVIELKDLEGLTNQEIAARLGVSVDNAKIRLHRARQALRRELERGCEFYQSETGTRACDRKNSGPVVGKSVSSAPTISSKEVRPAARARRARTADRIQNTTDTSMNLPSNCGCGLKVAFAAGNPQRTLSDSSRWLWFTE